MRSLLILILLISFSTQSSARKFAWRLQSVSALYGFTFYHDRGFTQSFEVLYDYSGRLKRKNYSYFGIGFAGAFDSRYTELGLKIIAPPITKPIRISRRTSLLPFIFVQGNWKTKKNTEGINRAMNCRPGIGINGHIGLRSRIVVKPSLQVGYTVWDKFGDAKKGLVIEFRLGIGLNTFRFMKKNKALKISGLSF